MPTDPQLIPAPPAGSRAAPRRQPPWRRTALLLLAGLLLVACSQGARTAAADGAQAPGAPEEGSAAPPARWPPEKAEAAVADVGAEVVAALAQSDIGRLASLVHSRRGVRLSPYAYVAADEHVELSASELVEAWSDPAPRIWGYEDATGEAIELTLPDYVSRFVYDGDFARAADVGYNTRLGAGNTIDNAAEAYPDGVVVEYHLPGVDPAFGGMDWRSLRLVFARDDGHAGAWRLVAIIHDQWTI